MVITANQPLIILDVDNLCHRNHYALCKGMFKTPAIHGFLRDLQKFSNVLGSNKFVFCFDDPKGSIRKVEFPAYKSKRRNGEDRDTIRKQILTLKTEILPLIGFSNIFQFERAEADDLIGHLAKSLPKSSRLYLVSSDADLYQLLDDIRVRIWSPVIKQTIDSDWMEKTLGVSPEDWVYFKSICGCTSDSIPGVKGVGSITSLRYLRGEFSVLSAYYQRIRESDELIERNRRLIHLPHPDLNIPKLQITEDTINSDKWDHVMRGFYLESLVGKCP